LNSIYFIVKSEVDKNKHKLLELFFKDWVDTSCDNEVQYKVEEIGIAFLDDSYTTFKVDFEKQEDALALRLRGVPAEFQNYLEIVD
jgi:chitinase